MSEQAGEQQGGTGGEAQTGGTGTGATHAEPQVRTSGTQVREAQATAQAQQASGNAGDFDSLPAWAQAEVRKLRAEAGNARVTAKESAAEEARKELLAQLSKALGQGETPTDPEKLKADLEKTTAERRSTLVELAVVRAAPKLGGDPDALLDSRGFLTRLSKLDPTAPDFAQLVQDEIAAAVKDNPKLSAGTPATRSGGEITGGAADKVTDGESWDDMEKLVRRKR